MDIGTPILFENIKIEADSDSAFFGLEVNDGTSTDTGNQLGGYSGSVDDKLTALLSSVSPYTITGVSTSTTMAPPVANAGTVTEGKSMRSIYTL